MIYSNIQYATFNRPNPLPNTLKFQYSKLKSAGVPRLGNRGVRWSCIDPSDARRHRELVSSFAISLPNARPNENSLTQARAASTGWQDPTIFSFLQVGIKYDACGNQKIFLVSGQNLVQNLVFNFRADHNFHLLDYRQRFIYIVVSPR